MNNNEIKQRLIRAVLTEDVPVTPQFDFPHRETTYIAVPRWAGVAAAACVVAAIALPLALRQPSDKDYTVYEQEEAALELEEAFAMIDQHFSSSNDLIRMVQ